MPHPFTRHLRLAALTLGLSAGALPAAADQYIMGAGQWTCSDVVAAATSDDESRIGQLAGWILGFWSAATITRDNDFVDTVESVGGRGIYEATVNECAGAPPDELLYVVSNSMVVNTK